MGPYRRPVTRPCESDLESDGQLSGTGAAWNQKSPSYDLIYREFARTARIRTVPMRQAQFSLYPKHRSNTESGGVSSAHLIWPHGYKHSRDRTRGSDFRAERRDPRCHIT